MDIPSTDIDYVHFRNLSYAGRDRPQGECGWASWQADSSRSVLWLSWSVDAFSLHDDLTGHPMGRRQQPYHAVLISILHCTFHILHYFYNVWTHKHCHQCI